MQTKFLMIIILDGFGVAKKSPSNAITEANPSNLSTLWNNYPHTYLFASSQSVGLPENTKGNSEVGHLAIGAGKVVYQNLPRINRAIENKSFYSNNTLNKIASSAKNVHLMGCISDGSVHSHINHLFAIIGFLHNRKINTYLHLFTDGRDTSPKSANIYFEQLEKFISDKPEVKIATICGRYFGMDRNQTWERTEKAYNLIANSQGTKYDNWRDCIEKSYQQGINDEFIKPSVITPVKVKNGDFIINFNFRADRALQISKSFADENFTQFKVNKYKKIFFTGMVEYEKNFPQNILVPRDNITLPLGRIISETGLRQLRIAESEKFAHITYFFNGGANIIYPNENRIEIQSPNVPTYDYAPEMSALQITEVLKERISQKYYNLIVVNFANGDMVGHTGNLEASKLAVKIVDYCVGELTRRFLAFNGKVIITADHGNVEELLNPKTGEVDTEHSINPVPFILAGNDMKSAKLPLGILADIAPTALKLMGINIPSEMTGKVLI